MDLYNEDAPGDNLTTRETKRWRREQLAKIFQYQEALKTDGLTVKLDAKPDFDRAASNDSLSFLTKLISSVQPKDHSTANTNAVYDHHFMVHYIAANAGKTDMLHIKDLNMDYKDKNKTIADQAIIEKVKAAMILAHSAKVLGWTKVSFAETTDPLSRLALKMACTELGLKADSEKIDTTSLEKHMVGDKNLVDAAYAIFKQIEESPTLPVARPQFAHPPKTETPANNNADLFDFELAS